MSQGDNSECVTTGTLYFAELLINFHVGFIGKYGTQKKIVLDGKAVAWYYITQGQFLVDTLTAVAWIAQVPNQASTSLRK